MCSYVYGARSTAAKTRRCGECEGCNREDCGKCVTCLDKPKFGGKWLTTTHNICNDLEEYYLISEKIPLP